MKKQIKPAPPFEGASYIKAQQKPSDFSFDDPLPRFRRVFHLSKAPENEALLYLQAPGFAVCKINGHPVTENVFDSPISDYCKILWYSRYDVTPLLREGENVISVILGNGFFNEPFRTPWNFNVAPWRDAPQFVLSLVVDGQKILVSDESWKADRESSPIRYGHLRSGEYVDARLLDDSWEKDSFDDAAWMPAIARKASEITGELRLCPCRPIREVESYMPISVTETARGYLVDFGVTMSGYMSITLKEERGREIRFFYTEEVDEQLAPQYNGMDAAHFYPEAPFQQNKLIASGGVDTFKPMFSYHGFRYVLIEGMTHAPEPSSMRAYFTHNDIARRSSFDSGNEVLNFIYNAGLRSTYSNLFGCLTDCPTREKQGWTNDAQATTEQVLINLDILPLFEKWFEDIKVSIRKDGALPGIVPTSGWGYNWGPVCDCLLYELPYRTYLYTGDATMLTDAIGIFEKYANSLEMRLAAKEELKLGDWLGYGNSPLVSKDFVNEFYLLKAFRITALAHRLAKTGDTSWQQRYDCLAEAFLSRYIDDGGRCIFDHQTPLAILLENGLVRDRAVLERQLIAAVERDKFCLTSGMVGVQYLYDALAHAGRADYAVRLIVESDPGYRTWMRSGATTLWERWDGETSGSHNHHMYSGVIAWFYKTLLGICPTEADPGFRKISLQPAFISSIGYVKGHEETVRGRIDAQWHFDGDGFLYRVQIPEGIEAEFRGERLSAGAHEFYLKKEDA